MNNIDKIRMTIEFGIDKTKCDAYGVKASDVLENILITESDTIDGFEIYPTDLGLDVSRDFVLTNDVSIVSKELIENTIADNNKIEGIAVTDVLTMIENKAKQIKEKEMIEHRQEEIIRESLVEKIHNLRPRIEKLLLVANKCITENIAFPDCRTTTKFGYGHCHNSCYNSYNFLADGIYHHVGFMDISNNNSKNKQVKYLGIDNGGVCGVYDFYTNGELIFSKHERTGEVRSALTNDMKNFLDEFDAFETAFYKWVITYTNSSDN